MSALSTSLYVARASCGHRTHTCLSDGSSLQPDRCLHCDGTISASNSLHLFHEKKKVLLGQREEGRMHQDGIRKSRPIPVHVQQLDERGAHQCRCHAAHPEQVASCTEQQSLRGRLELWITHSFTHMHWARTCRESVTKISEPLHIPHDDTDKTLHHKSEKPTIHREPRTLPKKRWILPWTGPSATTLGTPLSCKRLATPPPSFGRKHVVLECCVCSKRMSEKTLGCLLPWCLPLGHPCKLGNPHRRCSLSPLQDAH